LLKKVSKYVVVVVVVVVLLLLVVVIQILPQLFWLTFVVFVRVVI
jgi:hypothetical protein